MDVDALRYVPLNLLLAIVVTAVVVALGASVPGLRARDRRRAARAASRALLAGSVIAILAVTLASSTLSSGTNLVPLRGIAGQVANLNGQVGALNILGNAVMFLPAGLLAPMAFGWGIRRVTAAACALSVAIEIVQLASAVALTSTTSSSTPSAPHWGPPSQSPSRSSIAERPIAAPLPTRIAKAVTARRQLYAERHWRHVEDGAQDG